MVCLAPTLSLLTACIPVGARTFLHGSLVLGCPSVRVHDPRVVETGIEVPSLLSAFPGHPLSAANSASFSDTIHIPGTDVASDAREINGVCPHLHLDTTESALSALMVMLRF